MAKKKNHYVNNKMMLEEIIKYKKMVSEAEEKELPVPPVTDYLGISFLEIAKNLTRKSNFYNYTYTDDMIMDAVENCLKYISNFDPEKSNNPFSYFTQIIYHAFVRKIKVEKKQQYIKYKSIVKSITNNEIAKSHINDDAEVFMGEFINTFETSYEKKKQLIKEKKESKKNKLEFVAEEDE